MSDLDDPESNLLTDIWLVLSDEIEGDPHSEVIWALRGNGGFDWYTYEYADGETEESKISITDNIPLLIAIIVSLVIAGIFAVIAF
eukprot:CAMPEP_0201282320 /NCGR_PEP_ID=MMETSP1317-20130820/5318_1 /ASSEMBLY_ACC=CAM_ASM_000770 /TAXON_ID=187299 /ORGANISM="Undescribed Undescribed, Strain Undescribed" /LENGTH=85 /DNA_ID=CAMNT_0047594605 /DNA_START=444 /DNA_END=698 /DNA_ORIENTATION=+